MGSVNPADRSRVVLRHAEFFCLPLCRERSASDLSCRDDSPPARCSSPAGLRVGRLPDKRKTLMGQTNNRACPVSELECSADGFDSLGVTRSAALPATGSCRITPVSRPGMMIPAAAPVGGARRGDRPEVVVLRLADGPCGVNRKGPRRSSTSLSGRASPRPRTRR